jgi:glutamine cyclotransferase
MRQRFYNRWGLGALLLIGLSITGCNETGQTTPAETTLRTVATPGLDVVATYPHDTSSYTQGLVVYKGQLYEGTGQYGASALLKTELATGKAVQRLDLGQAYFGEGITILNDTIYQLTWKEQKIFVYDMNFKKINTFSIDKEGWGLTHNGSQLILTNGSGDLFFYEPSSLKLLRVQTVTEAGTPSFNLNELEYAEGFIYANQYTYPYVLKIDPNTGEVVAKYDLSRLWEQCRQRYPNTEVPNGIAYDSEQKKWYVTGKNWPLLYQIQWGH